MSKAEDYVRRHGTQGLRDQCTVWLTEAQDVLQGSIDFGKVAP
jgi:hypothetical protein